MNAATIAREETESVLLRSIVSGGIVDHIDAVTPAFNTGVHLADDCRGGAGFSCSARGETGLRGVIAEDVVCQVSVEAGEALLVSWDGLHLC